MRRTVKNNDLQKHAVELRNNQTEQERHLWYCFLKAYPVRFYRQRIIDNYIVDFYCSSAKLVVEIDGSQHYEPEDMEYDRKRTKDLEKYGLKVLRFSNRDINVNFRSVCDCIHNTVTQRIGREPYKE